MHRIRLCEDEGLASHNSVCVCVCVCVSQQHGYEMYPIPCSHMAVSFINSGSVRSTTAHLNWQCPHRMYQQVKYILNV